MVKSRYQATKHITIISAIKNCLLSVLKIVIGYTGHSHALIADGVHSLSDLVTDGLIYIAAKTGGQSPDEDHPYGHQRIETIATIIIAILLIFVGAMIIYDEVYRFLNHAPTPVPQTSVIIVAIASIILNEGLYHYTINIGNRVQSSLLISSAWHNRSDAFVSLIVLLSAAGMLLGFHHLDLIGTLIIALLILKTAFKMAWSGARELVDTGVESQVIAEIKECIRKVNGVVSVHQLRTRTHGNNIFVDVHIIVDPFVSVSEGHYIGEQVHQQLIEHFKNISDVTVHVDAEDDEISQTSLRLPNRHELLASLEKYWGDLPGYSHIRKINLHYINGQLLVEVYLPLGTDTNLYLDKAKSLPLLQQVKFYYE